MKVMLYPVVLLLGLVAILVADHMGAPKLGFFVSWVTCFWAGLGPIVLGLVLPEA